MKGVRTIIRDTAYLVALLGVLFIPIGLHLLPLQETITQSVFGKLITLTAKAFLIHLHSSRVTSDSLAMYLLVLLLFLLSAIGALKLKAFDRSLKATTLIRTLLYFYLGLVFMRYGADKLFKGQFYLPEPNILYTPFGKLSKDMLYWSTVGTSYSYNIFLGSLEVLCAILLIIRRTRLLGLVFALITLVQILAINFCFDISVKLYSSFLLFLVSLLLLQYAGRLSSFFAGRAVGPMNLTSFRSGFTKHRFVRTTISTFVILSILGEALYPYMRTATYNDDLAGRGYLQGAYEVIQSRDTTSTSIKRFFIHRDGYLITESDNEEFDSNKLFIDTLAHIFHIENATGQWNNVAYNYNGKDSSLTLRNYSIAKKATLHARAINWRELPALQKSFHWTVDNY